VRQDEILITYDGPMIDHWELHEKFVCTCGAPNCYGAQGLQVLVPRATTRAGVRRRTLRAGVGAVPGTAGHLAADADELRARSRAVDWERTAVYRPERREAPHRRAKRAHQRRLCGGPQRDQGGRLTDEHDPNGGPDRCCDLLAGPCPRPLQPDLSHAGRQPAIGHRPERPPVRHDQPGCG
jgi:hypothetical protein